MCDRWIRQAIQRAIADKASTIRLPAHVTERLNGLFRAQRMLARSLGRDPCPHEVAAEVGMTPAQAHDLMRMSQLTTSLQRPVGEEGAELGDFIGDEHTDCPLDSASAALRRQGLGQLLDRLPARERAVVELRFGLGNGEPLTLEKTGRALGVTRERVRQLQAHALGQLAALAKSSSLQELL